MVPWAKRPFILIGRRDVRVPSPRTEYLARFVDKLGAESCYTVRKSANICSVISWKVSETSY